MARVPPRMTPPRWTLALENGEFAWPDAGCVLVLRAQAEADFAALGPDRLVAVQGFAPAHDRLAARGLTVEMVPDGVYAAALVQIVKSKAETLSLVAQALVMCRPAASSVWTVRRTRGSNRSSRR